MAEQLSDPERDDALAALPLWSYDASSRSIRRTVTLASFSEAFAFMARVALLAEKADHHPDWANSYNKVTISLSTHAAGGITDKDIALARSIDRLG